MFTLGVHLLALGYGSDATFTASIKHALSQQTMKKIKYYKTIDHKTELPKYHKENEIAVTSQEQIDREHFQLTYIGRWNVNQGRLKIIKQEMDL